MSFKKILVAVGDSPLCPHVFEEALELARLNNGVLQVVHCIIPEAVGEATVPMHYEMGIQPNLAMNDYYTQQVLVERQMKQAQAILERYQVQARNQNIPVQADYYVGDAGVQICEVAKNCRADLIVVGRRGRTGLAEAFLGSVSNYVVHHAPCSVLVIQRPETDADNSEAVESDVSVVDAQSFLRGEPS
jgi:nucleotide-binding universal stress UspA family protein